MVFSYWCLVVGHWFLETHRNASLLNAEPLKPYAKLASLAAAHSANPQFANPSPKRKLPHSAVGAWQKKGTLEIIFSINLSSKISIFS